MIYLLTGGPGNGKTLFLLWDVEHRRRKEKREVYYSGIRNLNLPWIEFGDVVSPSEPHMTDPSRWPELPAGSIIVIDECQRLYRPRALTSKVPAYVEALETHRHKGFDIYLVTQHPTLIETNVRRLVETHRHMMRKFGSTWSTVHEWKGVKENCDKSRAQSIESQFKYPKEVFKWYKSAEVHTVKFRMPAKFILLLTVPFLVAGLAWYASSSLTKFGSKTSAQQEQTASQGLAQGGASKRPAGAGAQGSKPENPDDYLQQFVPRVQGLYHTAPRYDGLTEPVRVPIPVGCVLTGEKADSGWCFTQQGTRFFPPFAFVQDFVRRGFFVDFEPGTTKWGEQATVSKSSQVLQNAKE